jgi:hypothetical protein
MSLRRRDEQTDGPAAQVRAGHRRNAVIAVLTILLVLTTAGGVGTAAFQ